MIFFLPDCNKSVMLLGLCVDSLFSFGCCMKYFYFKFYTNHFYDFVSVKYLTVLQFVAAYSFIFILKTFNILYVYML